MSVRVAVFGTSRSGKDYTIRDASETLAENGMLFAHISPISLVHIISRTPMISSAIMKVSRLVLLVSVNISTSITSSRPM